ncbi:DEAD/DEAH box helicase [Azospirillum picis]|uniref:Superfamily II DNA or RNA helicase n=1 Tax=Azospirillum picis TaxID=488438 RepID=A0ABU0MDS5_9PROT|nr:DEAD/DEAH box helicase family protein [Azospirillum picis]MBP2297418.1 superfamily II DNA or RNA helicase [Azospirillum picis]MDQ0531559.1 superfamily II DNA or RNA helicase [Azospirillum picis]
MPTLRSHQSLVSAIAQSIGRQQTEVRDVLAAVTPGGGKSLLPVIMAAALQQAGVIDRVCWIVPRDSLRRQAEEAFADPRWRDALGHGLSLRAAENGRDLCRGQQGYVTTYQAVAAAPDLHLQEFRRHRYLLAVDELHHLPAVFDTDRMAAVEEETSWSRSILPLLESAAVRLLMSGTLERADGRPILWLPYRAPHGTRKVREIDFKAPGWAVVGYSRRQALAEKAILPVTFGAMDASASWLDAERTNRWVDALSKAGENTRDALFTALRTGFAKAMLREAYRSCREHRARRRAELKLPSSREGPGLGKLLVIAPDQETARGYLDTLRGWMPQDQAGRMVQLAISDQRDAQEVVAAFRLRPEPAVLVSVAMAYEGLDAPAITHVACLTHIRSRPWLEQAIARATRVDPQAGTYDQQRALVYHPSDELFERFRTMVETQQGTRAMVKTRRGQQELPFDRPAAEREPEIIPLESNATALKFAVVAPGPDFGAQTRDHGELPLTPSAAEHHLRQRIGQLVAAQVIEDEDNNLVTDGPVGYHVYNAVLKRLMKKARSEMTLSELEATIGWLERNRLSDHRDLLGDDPQYRWSSRRRTARGPAAMGRRAGAPGVRPSSRQ